MNVVVLAPHTDDAELGCGGTIAKLIERGYDVYVYAFDVGKANEEEYFRALRKLGAKAKLFKSFHTRYFHKLRQEILDKLIEIRKEIEPVKVFVPAQSDCHQDHQVITQEAIRAFKHCSIYGYEAYWNSFGFRNDMYTILSGDHLSKKCESLSEYESQNAKAYFNEDNIIAMARVRGVQAGSEYAECFEVIRQFL